MESELIKITKLKGADNWGVWKFQLRVMFLSHDIFDIIEGRSLKPNAPAADATAAVTAEYQKGLKEWTKSDAIAQKYIVTSVEKVPMLHILNCLSAKAMWDKHHEIYENKSGTSVHMLQQKWFAYTKEAGNDIATHISKVEDLGYKLKSLGEQISDTMLITKILMTLPPKFNHFVSAWESTSENLRTVENLTSRLVMEEKRVCSQESNESDSIALLSKNFQKNASFKGRKFKKSGEENNFNKNKKSEECWFCNKKGHRKKECWAWKKQQKEKGGGEEHCDNEGNALIVSEVILMASGTDQKHS